MTRLGQILRQSLEAQIEKNLDKKDNIFVLKYPGVSSPAMSDLRKELRRQGAGMVVVRNSIVRRALKNIKLDNLETAVDGPVAFVYSDSDAAVVSKILVKFVKSHETTQLTGGVLQQNILGLEDIKRLSSLPSRDILLSMLLSAIQSPISSLAYVLSAKTRELLYILKQIAEKKET
ncbi:MAG: 50S ribosomal protein L10 [Candidatus Omnitrophota bacterium]|nr:50S ribosomal protein L10 [Candidatus Omnitrophota bacterium]